MSMKLVILSLAAGLLSGQTALDLRTQTRNVDFSGAVATKPSKVGTTLPVTCSIGETFFKTTAVSGQNLYGCTATNSWSLLGGGASSFADIQDCKVTANGASITIAAPCGIRAGTAIRSLGANAVASLSGTVVSGSVFVYWDSMGRLVADENTSATLGCNQFCINGTVGGFPWGSTPLATVTFANNSFTQVTDHRVMLSARNIVCGTGLICTEDPISGELTVLPDTTTSLATKNAVQSGQIIRCISNAAGSAHTCGMNPGLPTYATGMVVEFVATAGSLSGPASLNIDGLGAKAIKRADGISDPGSNEIAAGQQVALRYDGTVFRLPKTGDRTQAGTFASLPPCASGDSGTMYLFTDSLYSAARCNGSAWSYFHDGRAVAPPAGTWNWDNQNQGGAASLDSSRGFHLLSVPATHTTGYAVRYQTAPGGGYSRTFAVRMRGLWGMDNVGYMVGFRDSSGQLEGINVGFASSFNANSFFIDVRRQTSAATVTASSFDFPRTVLANLPPALYFRIADDTTNISFGYSVDGHDFHTLYTGPRAAFLSSPGQIFFAASASGAAMGAALDVISIQ
jgi:hypothetical protein